MDVNKIEYDGRVLLDFAKRIDDEQHRQNKRIDSLEQTVKEISSLATSVEKLANNMANMVKEQEKQGKRLEALEGKDGEMWRTVVKYVLTTALGLVIGIVAMQIGLK